MYQQTGFLAGFNLLFKLRERIVGALSGTHFQIVQRERASVYRDRRLNSRRSDDYRVWLCPNSFSVALLQAIHGDPHFSMVHFDQQVVIIHLLALKWIVWSSLDRIRVCGTTSGHKIRDATMLMVLVIVDVPVEYNDAGTHLFLPRLEGLRQLLLLSSGRMATSEFFIV